MRTTFAGKALRGLGAAVVVAALGAGAAYATTSLVRAGAVEPAVIQGCKNPGNGGLRVVATPADCHKNETPIAWNAVGPAGPPGVSPTVTALAPGDANCPAGGAVIADAFGSTAYACNGESFAGTFTSPNGQFSLRVDDNGVKLAGPGNQTVTISGAGIKAEGNSVELKSSSTVKVDAATNFDLKSIGASIQAAANLDLEGGHVSINGAGSCAPAARMGDPAVGGVITGGSPLVCVGP